MAKLLPAILLFYTVYAQTVLKPEKVFLAEGGVKDAVYKNGLLYVATEVGTVEVFDIEEGERVKKITLPDIEDFFGEKIKPKVYSVDVSSDDTVYMLVQSTEGFSQLFSYKNGNLELIIPEKDKILSIKAKLYKDRYILLGLPANDLILFDLKERKKVYQVHISRSPFSDFAINKDKVAVACESGIVYILDIPSGKLEKEIPKMNLDKTFKIDFKGDYIFTGGRDKRATLYNLKTDEKYVFKTNFFVYSVGLSPSLKYGAYGLNEQSDIAVFDLLLKITRFVLKGHSYALNNIIFVDDTRMITTDESRKILYWRLKR